MKGCETWGMIEQREALRDLLAFRSRRDRGRLRNRFRDSRQSANLVVDLANTCDYPQPSTFQGSGANLIVGNLVDMMFADTFTNVYAVGGAGSGAVQFQIQTSPDTTSGNFTDPTSGLAAFPVNVTSGGIFTANSGIYSSGISSVTSPASGVVFQSGGIQFGAFQRPNRYARLIQLSSVFPAPILAGFIGNKRVTGSGGGFTYSPTSGTVNV